MVVGYQSVNTVAGFNFIAPTFESVTETGVSIQDIKLGDGASEYSDSVQVLDDGGATTETYFWTADGWVDGNTFEVTDKKITAGASVLVDTANPLKVTMSGKVGEAEYKTTSVAGFNFVGNTKPVDIDIQKIKLIGDASEYSDSIQILDDGGATIETYFWTADGWVDGNTFELATKNIPAGQGLLIDTANAGVSITVPAAL